VMDRLVLSDAAWERMAPLIIGRPDQKGSTGRDNRMFLEGVLWIVRTGCPCRDLPEAFGDWNSVFRRSPQISTIPGTMLAAALLALERSDQFPSSGTPCAKASAGQRGLRT
jgi:transposase